MFKRLARNLLFIAITTFGAALVFYWKVKEWAVTPKELSQEVIVELKPGESLARFAEQLRDAGLVSSGKLFAVWVRLGGRYRHFQAGKYRFAGAVTPEVIINDISRGLSYTPVVVSITVPEGWQLRQIIGRLAANQIGTSDELRHLAHDQNFVRQLRVPSKNLEGYLYPSTYPFTKVPSASEALEAMVKNFWAKLPEGYENAVRAKGLTLAEAVAFASLIEAETLHDDERDKVSEVIWRRLKDQAPLGIDASVIYGISDYAGDLKTVHLQDAKNPYNSRIHKGLPPTPIGNPAAKSLAAVLTPTNLGYYYYVLIPGTTRHHFSKTLKEHNEHVRNLVNASRSKSNGERSKKNAEH